MTIRFACHDCGKNYKVSSQFAGKKVKCKQCGATVDVPATSEEPDSGQSKRAQAERSGRSRRSKSGRSGSSSSKRSSTGSKRSSTGSNLSASAATSKRSKAPASTSRAASRTSERGATGTVIIEALDLSTEFKTYERKKKDDKKLSRGTGRLVYFKNGKATKSYRLDDKPSVIGRGSDARIRLEDDTVSGSHLKLELRLGHFIATDLKSANGVIVNGKHLRRVSLRDGDIIQLGEAVLRIDCG